MWARTRGSSRPAQRLRELRCCDVAAGVEDSRLASTMSGDATGRMKREEKAKDRDKKDGRNGHSAHSLAFPRDLLSATTTNCSLATRMAPGCHDAAWLMLFSGSRKSIYAESWGSEGPGAQMVRCSNRSPHCRGLTCRHCRRIGLVGNRRHMIGQRVLASMTQRFRLEHDPYHDSCISSDGTATVR